MTECRTCLITPRIDIPPQERWNKERHSVNTSVHLNVKSIHNWIFEQPQYTLSFFTVRYHLWSSTWWHNNTVGLSDLVEYGSQQAVYSHIYFLWQYHRIGKSIDPKTIVKPRLKIAYICYPTTLNLFFFWWKSQNHVKKICRLSINIASINIENIWSSHVIKRSLF